MYYVFECTYILPLNKLLKMIQHCVRLGYQTEYQNSAQLTHIFKHILQNDIKTHGNVNYEYFDFC